MDLFGRRVMHALGLLQEKGACDKDFWIDVLLTVLGWLPGYAILLITVAGGAMTGQYGSCIQAHFMMEATGQCVKFKRMDLRQHMHM